MNNNKMMLIYGFQHQEIVLLDKFIEENKMPGYKIINDDMSKMKISDILEGYKFEIYNPNLPKEKVVIFNNFTDSEINIAIKCLKEIRKGVIMAVATPTSIDWTFEYLIEHLIEEREWYRKSSTSKQK